MKKYLLPVIVCVFLLGACAPSPQGEEAGACWENFTLEEAVSGSDLCLAGTYREREDDRNCFYDVFEVDEVLWGEYEEKLVYVYRPKTETGPEEDEELSFYKKGDRYYLVLDRGREYPAAEHPRFISPGDLVLPFEGECSFMGSPAGVTDVREFLSGHRPSDHALQ